MRLAFVSPLPPSPTGIADYTAELLELLARRHEVDHALKLLRRGDDPAKVLEALSRGLTNKLMHGPTQALNQAEGDERNKLSELVSRIFHLHPGE